MDGGIYTKGQTVTDSFLASGDCGAGYYLIWTSTRSRTTVTMSLLRTCQQAIPKHGAAIPLASYFKVHYSTSNPPVQEKDSTQITTPVEREVMVADVISGAPGEQNFQNGSVETNCQF